VHGKIGAAIEQRDLQLLHEQALAADLGQRRVEDLVALRGEGDELDLEAGMQALQFGADMLGLPQGQGGFAGGDAKELGHGKTAAA
jgi:hypothetical protein